MDAEMKKKIRTILILLILAVAFVVADLILFNTSLKEEGVGRGFSRYWENKL